jgi:hypothetical protein
LSEHFGVQFVVQFERSNVDFVGNLSTKNAKLWSREVARAGSKAKTFNSFLPRVIDHV